MLEARGGKNRDFSPPELQPSVELPNENRSLFRKEPTQVTYEKFFIGLCDPHRKFCKFLKFQNLISATNENYYFNYMQDM